MTRLTRLKYSAPDYGIERRNRRKTHCKNYMVACVHVLIWLIIQVLQCIRCDGGSGMPMNVNVSSIDMEKFLNKIKKKKKKNALICCVSE